MSRRSKTPMNGYYALRWEVIERDNFTCQYCGQHAPNIALEVDHIISVEDGGEDTAENLKTSCYACNRGRSGLRIRIKRSGKKISARPYQNGDSGSDSGKLSNALQILKGFPDGIKNDDFARELNITSEYAHVVLGRLLKRKLVNRPYRGFYVPC